MLGEHPDGCDDLFRTGLYALCEGLRQQTNGASDPWKVSEVERVTKYLRWRLDHWSPNHGAWDMQVRGLVATALTDVSEWQSEKSAREE